MKKSVKKATATALTIAMTMGFCAPAFAETVTVHKATIPVTINGVSVQGKNDQYPVISYNDILYLPLTYNMKSFTGLESRYYDTDYVKNFRFIGLAEPTAKTYKGYPAKTNTANQLKATVVDSRMAINGNADREIVSNADQPYPVLKCQDILYLPLTWDVVSNKLGWKYQFSSKDGLILDASKRTRPIVNLTRFVSGPSSIIWSMSYHVSEEGWVGYPDNTLEHNYQFKVMLKNQEEVTFSLEEDLQDAVYQLNYMMADSVNHCISTIEPTLKDGIFTIYAVRSVSYEEPRQTCLLKIDVRSQKVISKEIVNI